jgi:hypothetical protein
MKKAKSARDTLRKEYTRADFPDGLLRGRCASRISEGTNIVLLDPEIAATFPTSEAVNKALRGLLETARIVNRRRADTHEPLGRLKIVDDFLPPPERLVVMRTGSGATVNRGKKKVASRNRGRRQSK